MPGDSKSKVVERRVSNSKSGFNATEFVLIFKNADGTYSHPRSVPRELALAIARNYEGNLKAAENYGITRSTAAFIQSKAIRHGLLQMEESAVITREPVDTGTGELPPEVGERAHEGSTDKKVRLPRFFPKIDSAILPAFPQSMIEELAFVLSGVDPSLLKDPRVIDGTMSLKDLVQTSTARVSSGLLLLDDHWYVLAHLHQLDRSAFKQLWDEAHSQASGQGNTDIVKLIHRLDKFSIDPTAKCLDDYANKSFFSEVEKQAVEILSRNFRKFRRKIEVAYERNITQPQKSGLLATLFRRKTVESTKVSPISKEISEMVVEYLLQATKLGRILRSKYLKYHSLKS